MRAQALLSTHALQLAVTASFCAGATQHFRRHPFGLRNCCALLCQCQIWRGVFTDWLCFSVSVHEQSTKEAQRRTQESEICHQLQSLDGLRMWGTPSLTSSFAKGTNSSRVSRKLPCVSYFFIATYTRRNDIVSDALR